MRKSPGCRYNRLLVLNSHEHSERSIDSIVRADDRIYNAIANGVDIMTPTDHDFFGSFQEDIEELGLEKYVHSFWDAKFLRSGDIQPRLAAEHRQLTRHTSPLT